jgi:sec-independent protein translocase protein TatC
MPLDQSSYIDYDEHEEEVGKEMSFIEHLEELRWHILRSVIAILVFMIGSFIFMSTIYHNVILAPARPDFWTYKMFCKLGDLVHIKSLCVEKLNFEMTSRELSGQFMMSMTSAAIIGLLFAFPYVFWEVWRFILPGLKPTERKAARGAVFYVTSLFFMGVLFGYYVVSPLAINFLANYQIDPSIKNLFDITSYISVLATLTLACGLTFQLPIAIFVLTKVGIVGPSFLRTYRKHSFVIILVVAAVITPSPDMYSQLLVALPLYILYEVSIWVSVSVEKGKLKEAKI